jgi:hypothetical protein
MMRFSTATLCALFAAFCGPLAGSAAASQGLLPPTISGWLPPVAGSMLTATPAAPGDAIQWETCDASGNPIAALGSPSSTYVPTSSDVGTDLCAVESALGVVDGVSDAEGPVGAGPALSAAGASLTEGQTISVVQGQWGAATTNDVWYDCSAGGTACQLSSEQPGAGAYVVTSADVGSVIEVQETATAPSEPVIGSVFTAPTGTVTATPPQNTAAPGVNGTAQVGNTLTVSPGSWTIQPTSYHWQWQRCSAGGCSAIQGATSQTYVPVTADVGDTLEAIVTPIAYGVTGIAYPSAPTDVVVGVSSSPPTSTPPSTVVPVSSLHTAGAVGRLTATMRWTFRYAPAYTQIAALSVQGPALGATIATRCTGKGCPFTVRHIKVRGLKRCRSNHGTHCRAPRQVDLESQFKGRNLRVGSQVTVMISRDRDIGKYYRFVVRRRRAPSVKISCVAPGSSVPGKNCTGL